LDDAALTLASGTGAYLSELPEQAALGSPHLTVSPAGTAGVDLAPRLVAGAGAAPASLYSGYLHLFLDPENSLLKFQYQPLLQVGTPLGLVGAAAGGITKEGVKYVAESAEYIEAVEGTVESADPAHSGMPQVIVLRALFGVGQYLVGFIDFLKFFLGVGSLVSVRVVLHSLFAESLTDFLF